jgi:Zn-dependent protease
LTTILYTTATAIGLLISVILHEAGHMRAMRKLGIDVEEAGVGLAIRPRILLKPSGRRTFALSFSPWLFGAYVRASEKDLERIETLSHRDNAWYAGMGIIVNFVIGSVLLGIYQLTLGRLVLGTILVAAAVVIWAAQRPFAAYVLPVLSWLAVVGIVRGVIVGFGEPVGMLGTAQLLVSHDALRVVGMLGLLNLALGLLNALPFPPLDGGYIWMHIIERRFGKRAGAVTMGLGMGVVVLMSGYAIFSDIVWGLF